MFIAYSNNVRKFVRIHDCDANCGHAQPAGHSTPHGNWGQLASTPDDTLNSVTTENRDVMFCQHCQRNRQSDGLSPMTLVA